MRQEYYEVEGSIKCIEDYCKEQKLFTSPTSKDMFEKILEQILNHYFQHDPEFNEDPQDMIHYC